MPNEDPTSNAAESTQPGTHLIQAARAQIIAARQRREALAEAGQLPGNSSGAATFAGKSFPGYQLLRELHRGGQGVVYAAKQESTDRQVAMKILRHGPLAQPDELARFRREVEVLSLLRHPHVVTIHDCGRVDESVFLVMDYIAGHSLDGFVAREKPSISDILRLFAKICDGVNAAHLRGIIHRDLKPSNIRVDEQGEPRVLDFGLAKLCKQDDEASSAGVTLTGQFVGSLPWASPEQASGKTELLDIRSDVYSLGVILYHLLTGTFPYSVSGRMDEIVRNITQIDPARPSASVIGIDTDVETIVLKCLSKKFERRYQSAGELARDIRHFLANEPIEARRDSASYVFRKQLRRHWVAVTVTIGFVILLAGGFITSLNLWHQTEQALVEKEEQRSHAETARLAEAEQRDLAISSERRAHEEAKRAELETDAARRERDKTEKFAGFMEQTLEGVGPQVALGRDTKLLKELMDAAASRIEAEELRASPEAELRLRLTIGRVYRMIADYAAAEHMLRPAVDLAERLHGHDSAELANALIHYADWLERVGRSAEALPKCEEGLAIRRRLFPGDHPTVATALHIMGSCIHSLGRSAEALSKHEEALAMRRRLFPGDHEDVANTLLSVGICLNSHGRWTEALLIFEETLAMRRRLFLGDHPDVAQGLQHVASCLDYLGRSTEALPMLEEALAMRKRLFSGDHPNVASSLKGVATCLSTLGRLNEALPLYEESLAINQRLVPGGNSVVSDGLNSVAVCLNSLGRSAEALPKLEEALAIQQRIFPGDHPRVASSLGNLAFTLNNLGRSAEALPRFEESLAMRRRLFTGDHPSVATSFNNLASCLDSLGRSEEALPKHEEALAMRRRLFLGDHLDVASSLNNLAFCQCSLGRPAEALLNFEEALAMFGRVLPFDHWRTRVAEIGRGAALVDLERYGEAENILIPLWLNVADRSDVPKPRKVRCLESLIRLSDAFEAINPGVGHAESAAEWRAKLAAIDESTKALEP